MNARRSVGQILVVVFLAAFAVNFMFGALALQVGMLVRIVVLSALIAVIFSLLDRGSGGRSGRKPKSQAYYSDRR